MDAILEKVFQFLANTLIYFKPIILSLWSYIVNIYGWLRSAYSWGINSSFLSDVTAFNSAIIGLWIPLSISIITKISERYGSEVIIRSFENRWANIFLPRLLLLNLILTVCLRFFMQDSNIGWLERLIAWISLFLFLASIAVLYRSIKMVKDYTYQTDAILNGLIKNAEEYITR